MGGKLPLLVIAPAGLYCCDATVDKSSMDHVGALRLDDQPPLEATLRLADDSVTILADAQLIGTWELHDCQIIPQGNDFRLAIAGDEALFTPVEPNHLQGEISQRWPAQSVPAIEPNDSGLIKWLAAGLGVILAAIVIGGLAARDHPTPGLLNTVPTTTPGVPAVFSGGVDQITMLWNEAASELNLGLFLLDRPGSDRLQMNLRPGLVVYATEDPGSGTVRSLMISAAPTSNIEDGDAVLASWGILIATINPELDGLGRRQVLAELGVDPDRPLTLGLDAVTTVGRATYRLRSGVLGNKALLSVVLAPTG
ncbi:MAG TPA: hypothetical protein VJ935_04945 [Acidimicrobiia bacterium]|nr:hypothetical protein [Acidimicrobiia bacterium]